MEPDLLGDLDCLMQKQLVAQYLAVGSDNGPNEVSITFLKQNYCITSIEAICEEYYAFSCLWGVLCF